MASSTVIGSLSYFGNLLYMFLLVTFYEILYKINLQLINIIESKFYS